MCDEVIFLIFGLFLMR